MDRGGAFFIMLFLLLGVAFAFIVKFPISCDPSKLKFIAVYFHKC